MIAVLPSMIHPKTAVLGRAGGGKAAAYHGIYESRGNGNGIAGAIIDV